MAKNITQKLIESRQIKMVLKGSLISLVREENALEN